MASSFDGPREGSFEPQPRHVIARDWRGLDTFRTLADPSRAKRPHVLKVHLSAIGGGFHAKQSESAVGASALSPSGPPNSFSLFVPKRQTPSKHPSSFDPCVTGVETLHTLLVTDAPCVQGSASLSLCVCSRHSTCISQGSCSQLKNS